MRENWTSFAGSRCGNNNLHIGRGKECSCCKWLSKLNSDSHTGSAAKYVLSIRPALQIDVNRKSAMVRSLPRLKTSLDAPGLSGTSFVPRDNKLKIN